MHRLVTVICILVATAACERASAITPNGSRIELPGGVAPVEFPAGTVLIESGERTWRLRVELAHTAWQRERGLMYRTAMPEDSGMLFAYEEDQEDAAFWMYNTLIPLSIAYIDSGGIIRSLVDMDPCPSIERSRCPLYPAGVTFRYALEVNQGYFEERGIGVGDRVRYQPD